MSTRKINFVPGEYYHIYNRGNSKQEIFLIDKDYKHFIKLLYLCNSKKRFVFRDLGKEVFNFDREDTLVHIGVYCLMPNHFHILIKEKVEGGISIFMKKLLTAYSMYFNSVNERTGGLFEGKFKSQYIDTDVYLKYIFSYIHLNPLKLINKNWKETSFKDIKKVENYLGKYRYSSFDEYIGNDRIESKILNIKEFPPYFPTPEKLMKELKDWITLST